MQLKNVQMAVFASNEVAAHLVSPAQVVTQSPKVSACRLAGLASILRISPLYAVLTWIAKVIPSTVVADGNADPEIVGEADDVSAEAGLAI